MPKPFGVSATVPRREMGNGWGLRTSLLLGCTVVPVRGVLKFRFGFGCCFVVRFAAAPATHGFLGNFHMFKKKKAAPK